MPPKGNPIYEPWPMFTWMSTPLYKQDHQSANQGGIFYCGRTIWPEDSWWMNNYESLGLEHTYWVVESTRKGAKCAECRLKSTSHSKTYYEPDRGYYELPKDNVQVVSLDGLARLVEVLNNDGSE